MTDIAHRVAYEVPKKQVFDALSTTEGLTWWWADRVTGDPHPGGRLAFYFGGPEPAATMEVVSSDPGSGVRWRCIGGPDDWVGTTVRFDLQESGDETVLLFTHEGFASTTDFMRHCSVKWALYLAGLKAGLEGGEPTPRSKVKPISSWG
ncbi:MAG TPA: SRPBCC domain-containing protein [Acidimicrobiales bacterium]|nr:SRPBCC domain-containing protein [Acidimicrobiales bacterium]